jgi:hypothetical protein
MINHAAVLSRGVFHSGFLVNGLFRRSERDTFPELPRTEFGGKHVFTRRQKLDLPPSKFLQVEFSGFVIGTMTQLELHLNTAARSEDFRLPGLQLLLGNHSFPGDSRRAHLFTPLFGGGGRFHPQRQKGDTGRHHPVPFLRQLVPVCGQGDSGCAPRRIVPNFCVSRTDKLP